MLESLFFLDALTANDFAGLTENAVFFQGGQTFPTGLPTNGRTRGCRV
ncbi:hypothetical protein [Gluconobacter japonicus]